jgi:hypothetical protein
MAFKSPFEIERSPDELTVKKQNRTSAFNVMLSIGLVLFLLFKLLLLLSPVSNGTSSLTARTSGNPRDLFWILLVIGVFLYAAASLIFQIVRSFFPSGESLNCDRENLVIGKIPTTNFRGKWTYTTFPVSSVKQMRWGVVKASRYGGGTGLLFVADDKTHKLLLGLEAPEASTILDALEHFHVDILRDPAMAMSVEMVESRRKSRFRFLF